MFIKIKRAVNGPRGYICVGDIPVASLLTPYKLERGYPIRSSALLISYSRIITLLLKD